MDNRPLQNFYSKSAPPRRMLVVLAAGIAAALFAAALAISAAWDRTQKELQPDAPASSQPAPREIEIEFAAPVDSAQ